MRIGLIGYGKMGKEIEAIALGRGHEISIKITSENSDFTLEELKKCDVAIEFSRPESVIQNIRSCFNANIPVVIGTTGWYKDLNTIRETCAAENQSILYATNFSVGVNIFFELNKRLAMMMNNQWSYDVSIEEIHHTQKLDSPSGTAITLAEGIMEQLERKDQWNKGKSDLDNSINIFSQRIDNIPGTHSVRYHSAIDDIEINHVAHNRKGFALGAVLAAEFLHGKKGIFTMKDVLNF